MNALLFFHWVSSFFLGISIISYIFAEERARVWWLIAGIWVYIILRMELPHDLGKPDFEAECYILSIIFFVIPGTLFILYHKEGLFRFCIYLNYFFIRKSPKEIFMERARQKKYESKRKEYEDKIRNIENQEEKTKGKLVGLVEESPELESEMIEYIPKDTGLYKGYLGEIERRVQEGQIKKTVRATRERVEEAKKLWQELAALYKSKVDVERTYQEFRTRKDTIKREFEIKEKKAEAEYERVDLENKVKTLELQDRKSELESRINEREEVKKAREPKTPKEPTYKEKQKKIIEGLEAKSEIDKFIIKQQEEREKKLIDLKNTLIAEGHTPEEASRAVEEARQQLAQMESRNL